MRYYSKAMAPTNNPTKPTILSACFLCDPEVDFVVVGAAALFTVPLVAPVGVGKFAGIETLFCAAQTLGS
jgi:hypothetical protein